MLLHTVTILTPLKLRLKLKKNLRTPFHLRCRFNQGCSTLKTLSYFRDTASAERRNSLNQELAKKRRVISRVIKECWANFVRKCASLWAAEGTCVMQHLFFLRIAKV